MEKIKVELDLYGRTDWDKETKELRYTMSFDESYKDKIQSIIMQMTDKIDQHILENMSDKTLEKIYTQLRKERKRRYDIKTLCENCLKEVNSGN